LLENDLEIIPVLNKVDLPVPILRSEWYVDLLGCKLDEIIHVR
jgi:translation elongation factor EF-4